MKNRNPKSKTITVPSGIGDLIWCLQTLDLKYKYHIQTATTGANDHGNKLAHRAHPLLELLPSVISSIETGIHRYGKNGAGCNYQVNTHLEQGKRLESFSKHFSPVLPFKLFPYESFVDTLMNKEALIHIGIYSSAQKNIDGWKGWGVYEWVVFARKLNSIYGSSNIHFYCIGAPYDDTTQLINEKLNNSTLVQGHPLGFTMALLQRLDNVFAFASGIPILSTMFGVKTMMFYPEGRKDLNNLSTSFPPKKQLIKGIHRPKTWGKVDNIVSEITLDNWI